MQEMEAERVEREKEEQERVKRLQKIKNQFNNPNSQWEKDKNEVHNLALKEKQEGAPVVVGAGEIEKPVAAKDENGGKTPAS